MIAKCLLKKYSLWNFFNKDPVALNIYLTYKCNSKCTSCTIRKNQSPELSTDEWKKIIKYWGGRGVRVITIEGGEPTLRKDLSVIIDYCSSLNMRTIIVTNCSNDISKLNPTVFWISVDGFGSNNDLIRGEGHFERVQKMLDKNKDKRIFFLMTINKKNKDDIIPLLNRFKDYMFLFNFYYDYNTSDEAALTSEEKIGIASKLLSLKKQGYKIFNSRTGIYKIGREKQCYPWLIPTIDPSGKVTKGCFISLFEKCECDKCDLSCYSELSMMYDLDYEARKTWQEHLGLNLVLKIEDFIHNYKQFSKVL